MPRTTVPLVIVAIAFSITNAFHCQHHPSIPRHEHRQLSLKHNSIKHRSHQLHAKPKKKTSSGAGFGVSSSPTNTAQKRTRSVSGYTGSGTKILAAAANNFDRLVKLHGKDAITDVYVRSPSNDASTFWFVGKVIRHLPDVNTDSDNDAEYEDEELDGTIYPTVSESILSQKRLILEYAKNQLRPQNLSGKYSTGLELWTAPGNSEMDVVQNKVSLTKIVGSTSDLREGFSVKDVGYNPEIYVGEEKEKGGLRVVRDEEGHPVKPPFDI